MNNDHLMNDYLWTAGLAIIAIAFGLFGLSAWWRRRNNDSSPATRGGRRRYEDRHQQ